jgi:hypothetical protein
MVFGTLEKKKLSIDNTKIILVKPTIVFSSDTSIIATHTVTADQVGRIDLISLLYYRDASYCDYILKWNNISNPFIITVGDILEIPMNISVLQTIKPIKMVEKSTNEISIRDQFINSKRISAKDSIRLEYLQRKATQKANGAKQILPPNLLKEGDTNIKIGNGKIII